MFELELSYMKVEKSILLRVGGKFLMVGNEDEEKGALHP